MKKKLGIALIIIAILFATNPFGVLPAIPVYLVGVILIWLSPTLKVWKLSFTIIPLLIWYPLLYLSVYLSPIIGTKLAQKIEFRFNENFRGRVTIVSPVEWGQQVIIENGREVINVPQDGIVYYQGNIDDGYTNWTYGITLSLGEVKRLNEFKVWAMTDSEKRLIRNDSLGIFTGGGWSAVSYQPEPMIEYNLRFLWLSEWSKRDSSLDDKDSLISVIEEELRKNKFANNKGYKQ